MDTITITQLKVFAHHGVFEEERQQGQDFYVNAKLFLDTTDAGDSDDLACSVHYGEVCDLIVEYIQQHTFRLLEAVAENTVTAVLNAFPLLKGMELEICKPHAPIPHPFENVSVTIRRMWHDAYIAVGSNLGDREKTIREGIRALDLHRQCRVKKVSELIITKPYGNVEQDDFLNGVLHLETLLSAHRLLGFLNEVEAQAGRERLVHWGPRTLDLDILFYDHEVIDSPSLHIPHADMAAREFVLAPLCEIAPHIRHPLTGQTVEEMLADAGKVRKKRNKMTVQNRN